MLNMAHINKDSNVEFSLIFANQSEEDILLHDKIENLSRLNELKFRNYFVVEKVRKQFFK